MRQVVLGRKMEVSLENALAKTESDAGVACEAATATVSALKKFRAAAKSGNLRELRKTIEAADQAIATLRQQFENAKAGWEVDEEAYLSGGNFFLEILHAAEQTGVKIFEQDNRLYCYPALIKVSPNEKSVFIDRKRENRIRPSVLVAHLKALQRKPPRVRVESLLAALFAAYSKVVAMRGMNPSQMAPVVPLLDIYELFTLLPGQAKDYSKQEFARDIYLLHRSGVDAVKAGIKVSFPASTGTKTLSRTISVITELGEEKRYYGICFTLPIKED